MLSCMSFLLQSACVLKEDAVPTIFDFATVNNQSTFNRKRTRDPVSPFEIIAFVITLQNTKVLKMQTLIIFLLTF